MSKPPEREKREVHYRGTVQGVGFRYTTRYIAGQFAVTGYVKNLADGRVFLLAEGEPAELDRFFEALRRELGRYIRDEQQQVFGVTEGLDDFGIRY